MSKTSTSLAVFIILFIGSCQRNQTATITNDIDAHTWKIQTQDKKRTVDVKWKTFEEDSIKIKVPIEWSRKNHKDVWLYFPDSRKNSNSHFLVQKYEVAKINLDAKEYLKEGFNQVSEEFGEFKYELKKLSFKNNKHCYIFTAFTNENGKDYITYELIYQPGNSIYDFTYKMLNDRKTNEINYRKFLLIVQSFEYAYDNVMDGEKILIEDEQEMKFEDL